MTSKERSLLIGEASKISPIAHIGKSALTPEVTTSVSEAFNSHELIKIEVNKNCFDDLRELAETLAARTHSQVVKIIGRKIVLYKMAKEPEKRRYNIV